MSSLFQGLRYNPLRPVGRSRTAFARGTKVQVIQQNGTTESEILYVFSHRHELGKFTYLLVRYTSIDQASISAAPEPPPLIHPIVIGWYSEDQILLYEPTSRTKPKKPL